MALQRDAVRRIRRAGAAPGGHRRLRGGDVRCRGTRPRDRHTPGAWRAASRYRRPHRAPDVVASFDRNRRRSRDRPPGGPRALQPAVRGETCRRVVVHFCGGSARLGRRTGDVVSDQEGVASRSTRRVAKRDRVTDAADNRFPLPPPIEPMLAKLADELPAGDEFLYEPKWDGFRAIVFRGAADLFIQSRDLRPLDRYFPELHDVLLAGLPQDSVVDGEIVIATPAGLDFDALQLRLHPAASRVAKLARETPTSFVAFDLLAIDGKDVRTLSQAER